MINHYEMVANFLTVTDDHFQQNVAYERMKHWMNRVMDGAILIDDQDEKLPLYAATGARIMAVPEEPVDQIIGILLYLKLNAIMENRMVVTDIELWSTQGDDTRYLHSHGENLGPRLGQDGWWTDARPIWGAARQRVDGKVVNLDRPPEWQDYDLGWEDTSGEEHSAIIKTFPGNDNK